MVSHLSDGTHSTKETRFRKAEISDIAQCVKLAREFAHQTPWVNVLEIDENQLFKLFVHHILNDSSLVLVGDEGVFAGTLVPNILNASVIMGQELIWFGKPGKEMLDAFEEWCNSQGVNIIVLSSLVTDRETSLRRLYNKYGYIPMETAYIKGAL